jgi:hypothetical protein
MNKAPDSSGTQTRRKAVDPPVSRTSSKSNNSGPTWNSVAPSSSSASDEHQHARGFEPPHYIRGSGGATYGGTRAEDVIFDAPGEHRIVLAIDYGTTFTGMKLPLTFLMRKAICFVLFS